MFYSMCHPEKKHENFYRERVNLFVALAPVTQVSHEQSWLLNVLDWAYSAGILEGWNNFVGNYSAMSYWYQVAWKVVCGNDGYFCLWMEGFITNSHTAYDDYDRFQVWLGHFPKETSWKGIYHAFQNINSGNFQLYDYKEAHIN